MEPKEGLNAKDLIRMNGMLYRILVVKEEEVLLIECTKEYRMPYWEPLTNIKDYTIATEEEVFEAMGSGVVEFDSMRAGTRRRAHEKFTMIIPALTFIEEKDTGIRNHALKRAASMHGISKRTLSNYLCRYLIYQRKEALAPTEIYKERKETEDQQNMKWAVDNFYNTAHKNTIADAYRFMIKERYTNSSIPVEDWPSETRFRRYVSKNYGKKDQLIKRCGLSHYQRNKRPLLGNGVQEWATNVGCGMLDSTVCDIYLCDDKGQVIGRPILTACIDGYSSLCCGYSLTLEGGMYSVRNMLLNVVSNKVEWCKKFGIVIEDEQWPCSELPGELITDMGSEYKSANLEQVTDLGCILTNLPPYRPDLKGPVEKFFDLIQSYFKPSLKGKGVVEADAGERGAHDYRKDACLTMEDFEKVIIYSILYYNNQRTLKNCSFTEDMIENGVTPYANKIWEYGVTKTANLIPISREDLRLVLLPRRNGLFSRKGLVVGPLRYKSAAYVERYLSNDRVVVAFNPDDVNYVYLVEDNYAPFELIQGQYRNRNLEDVEDMVNYQKDQIKKGKSTELTGRVDLMNHIETIANQRTQIPNNGLKSIRSNRQAERAKRRDEATQEEITNVSGITTE